MRINKYIAECGVTSRRNADILIKDGKVKLNGKTVSSPGVDVNEENDSVSVEGVKISSCNWYIFCDNFETILSCDHSDFLANKLKA